MNGIQIPPEWFQESPGRNLPGMRQNRILAESLFVDDVQIERQCLPMLNLGIINKQPHSLSTTTIVHDAYPPRSSPSPMASTNNDAKQPDTAHNEYGTPQHSNNDAATPCHHPQLANERLEHTTVPATWQTKNNDISRCSSSSSQVNTHHPSLSVPYPHKNKVPCCCCQRRGNQTVSDDFSCR